MLSIASDWGIDRLHGHLYQGGLPILAYPGMKLPDGVDADVLVLCAQESQFPAVMPPRDHLRIYRVPLDDAELSRREAEAALGAGHYVADQLNKGRRVVVTCQQGRNRSGLVSAIALVEHLRIAPSAAIAIIQRQRKNALTNPSFVRWLRSADPRPRPNAGM